MWHYGRPILGLIVILGAGVVMWTVKTLPVHLKLEGRDDKNKLELDVGLGENACRALAGICVGIVAYEVLRYAPGLLPERWQLGIGIALAAYVLVYGTLAGYALWPAVSDRVANRKKHATKFATRAILRGRLLWAVLLLGVGARLLSGSDFGWL